MIAFWEIAKLAAESLYRLVQERSGSILVGLGVVSVIVGFAREAITETKKVVWPSRKETVQTTGMVFAFVVVMAIFLWLTDKSLEWVMYDLVLGWK